MITDWESSSSEILLNPRLDAKKRTRIASLLPCLGDFAAHIWIATSGSTNKNPLQDKFVALSKQAVLASAAAVNRHLSCIKADVWLNPLPDFHVGGLGISARSYLTGSHMVRMSEWDPLEFHVLAEKHAVTLSALVPAQLFDLVSRKMKAPASLRGIVIGGGALNEELYQKAKELEWNVLPSYGMTECASQVATASVDDASLTILDHVKLKMDVKGFICLKSASLLTSYAFVTGDGVELYDPKVEGWLTTQDKGVVESGCLKMSGRLDDFIKIGGESVLFSRLEAIFEQSKLKLDYAEDCAIFACPDERLGCVVHLAAIDGDVQELIACYNGEVLPFERIRETRIVEKLPRSPLGKLLKAQLLKI